MRLWLAICKHENEQAGAEMIVIVQTSDGVELSKFDEHVEDDPALVNQMAERDIRTAIVLTAALWVAIRCLPTPTTLGTPE